MKVLTNNQVNNVLFLKENTNVDDTTVAEFRQLGSDDVIQLPVTVWSDDCFTVNYEIGLGVDALKNGLYTMDILNSLNEKLFSASVLADGNNNPDGYTISDDDYDMVYEPEPQTVGFSDGENTFSHAYITFSNDKNE